MTKIVFCGFTKNVNVNLKLFDKKFVTKFVSLFFSEKITSAIYSLLDSSNWREIECFKIVSVTCVTNFIIIVKFLYLYNNYKQRSRDNNFSFLRLNISNKSFRPLKNTWVIAEAITTIDIYRTPSWQETTVPFLSWNWSLIRA